MTRYRYKAFDGAGVVLEGELDAASEGAAEIEIRSAGATPFEVSVQSVDERPWWRRELFEDGRINDRSVAAFTLEFAVLLQARIGLGDALRIMSEQNAGKAVSVLARKLRVEVSKGRAISDALAEAGPIFKEDYLSVVRAGEMRGCLGEVFAELSALYERRLEVGTKVKSALVYPALLVAMAVLSIVVIATVLVPNIAPIFVENGKPLPWFIHIMLHAEANWMAEALGLAGLLLAGVVAGIAITQSEEGRARCASVQLRTPVIGPLVLQRDLARLTRTFGTLLKAGVPVMASFASAIAGAGNGHVRKVLSVCLDDVREGKTIASALKRHALLPPMVVHMVSVGEETGELAALLLRTANVLDDRRRRHIDALIALMTPVLTLSIAGLVGSLIMSIMTAILSINDLAIQ